jgi:DNA-binding CsgD family transcriptional regulator
MDIIKHYGTPRHSGRYPWGSGDNPEQRNKSFLGYVNKLKEQGLSEIEIANGLGMSTTQLRTRKSIAKSELRAAMAAEAQRYKEKNMSNIAIGERMGLNESSVRALLNPILQLRSNIAVATSNMLRDTIAKKGVIDIGAGVETHIGISKEKLKTAVSLLEEEGYNVHYVDVLQLGTGKYTSIKVLAPPGMEYPEIYKNRSDIKTISDFVYSKDGGKSYDGLNPSLFKGVNSDKVMVRYKEDGGSSKDGVIELRRGVDNLNLGNQKYAQVRIGVDGTHFLKGMAMYTDDIPKGYDIIYNTNKSKETPKTSVFKEMKPNLDNPFGATIKPNGQKGFLHVVNEEGDWNEWSRNISSQVLSKQSPALAKRQLDLARGLKQEEFDEILQITNPVVKKKLLQDFADGVDAASVHLKAAALPRQANKVILPINSLKETEIYAPTFKNGETVVLIRHPHGGVFEIPEVRVNNKNSVAKSVMGDAIDAIGIHPNVAKKLSGADFDGDTVLVIPNNSKDIRTAPSLKALKDFDTKEAYPPYDGMTTIDGGIYQSSTGKVDYKGKKPNLAPKQMKMGDVSNLITDMTIKGATADEIARAVKHSMVVIDSEKHHLNYRQSAIDNNVAALKKKYQGGERSGASTLISKAGSEKRVPFREEGKKIVVNPVTGKTKRVYIDPRTGKKLYEEVGGTFVNKKGQIIKRTTKTTRIAEEDDALNLSSGTKIETVYGEYANDLKAMANRARRELIITPNLVYSPSARETYSQEVSSLRAKLNVAFRNKPQERQAQLLANKIVSTKKEANPDLSKADLKRIKGQALEEARARTGAKKQKIVITDKEWDAIQLGAVSNSVLSQIIANTDVDALKIRATPRTKYKMTDSKIAKAKLMAARGYTTSEIASALGVSTSTIQETIK